MEKEMNEKEDQRTDSSHMQSAFGKIREAETTAIIFFVPCLQKRKVLAVSEQLGEECRIVRHRKENKQSIAVKKRGPEKRLLQTFRSEQGAGISEPG